jgi:hypothetical protein
MRTHVAVAAFAATVGLTGLAHAAQLLSPGLPIRVRETNVETLGACRVRNVGTKPIAVQVSVFSNNAVVLAQDRCNGQMLPAGSSCSVAAFLPDDSFVACRVTASSVTNLRGVLELSEVTSDHDVFLAEGLR